MSGAALSCWLDVNSIYFLLFFFFFVSICTQLEKIGTRKLTFSDNKPFTADLHHAFIKKKGSGGPAPCQKLLNSQGRSPCSMFSISVKHNEASFSVTKYPNVLYFLIGLQW